MSKISKLVFFLLVPILTLNYSTLAVAEMDPPLGVKELEQFYLMQSERDLKNQQSVMKQSGDMDYVYCRFRKRNGSETWAFGLTYRDDYYSNIPGEWVYSSYYGGYSFIASVSGRSILSACEYARKYYGYDKLLFVTAYEQVNGYYPLFVQMNDGQPLRISPDLLR